MTKVQSHFKARDKWYLWCRLHTLSDFQRHFRSMIQLYWLALGPSLSGFELHKWGCCPSCRKTLGRYGGFDRGSPPLPAPEHSWCCPWFGGSTCRSPGRQSSPGQESSAKVLLNHETPMSRKNETLVQRQVWLIRQCAIAGIIIRNSPSVFLCLALAYMPLTLTHTTPSETTMPGTMGTGGTTGDTGAGAVGATTEAELRWV